MKMRLTKVNKWKDVKESLKDRKGLQPVKKKIKLKLTK